MVLFHCQHTHYVYLLIPSISWYQPILFFLREHHFRALQHVLIQIWRQLQRGSAIFVLAGQTRWSVLVLLLVLLLLFLPLQYRNPILSCMISSHGECFDEQKRLYLQTWVEAHVRMGCRLSLWPLPELSQVGKKKKKKRNDSYLIREPPVQPFRLFCNLAKRPTETNRFSTTQ